MAGSDCIAGRLDPARVELNTRRRDCKIRVTKFDVYVKRRWETADTAGGFAAAPVLGLGRPRHQEEWAACIGHRSRISPSRSSTWPA
ncbi:MAG: hypothetical protein EOR12_02815 [Mesorhizobium sp.]|nr:MAG: hypothetical protein EOR12_02815 [Mesorhizobium sp.]